MSVIIERMHMNIKKRILNFSKKNTYFLGVMVDHYKKSRELEIIRIIEKLKEEDTLVDTSYLLEFRKKVETDHIPFFSYNFNTTNYRLYGIGNALFGELKEKVYLLPSVEHGLILRDTNWSDTSDTARASCVTFGPFRKNILRRYYKTPIFEVGPYIQYADDYYDMSSFKNLKRKIGKTLLVFPSHGTDQSQSCLEEEEYLNKIDKLANRFDSVMVCVFWWNLGDRLVTRFSNEGYKIVSAGFREDPNFLKRLKTIIKLSDEVVFDSIGTHIGYCYSLGKKLNMISVSTKYKGELATEPPLKKKKKRNIAEIIINGSGMAKDNIFNYYWGNNIRWSKKQLCNIAEINKEITLKGKYFTNYYKDISKKLLIDYKANDIDKYNLLLKALS